MKRLFLLLCGCLPMLALACIPPRYDTFADVARHAPDAVIGHFIRLNDNARSVGFTVTSSLRNTIKPGNYRLTIEEPSGPPDKTISMPCPTWQTVALRHLPEGASTDQRRWVLLISTADDNTLHLNLDNLYAAQWIKTELQQQDPMRKEIRHINAKQFVQWFRTQPAQEDKTAWYNAAPVWKISKHTAQ